jgi:hypothetical protein
MTRLELKVASGSKLDDACQEPTFALSRLTDSLIDIDLSTGGGSAQARQILLNSAVRLGWETDFLVSNSASRDFPDANFKINYLWVSRDCQCRRRHKIFLHRCFDNRQAIGTNVLRFLIADQSNTKSTEDDYIFVALVADEKAKKSSWDGAIGSYEEYFFAVHGGYSQLGLPPIDFLVIRS